MSTESQHSSPSLLGSNNMFSYQFLANDTKHRRWPAIATSMIKQASDRRTSPAFWMTIERPALAVKGSAVKSIEGARRRALCISLMPYCEWAPAVEARRAQLPQPMLLGLAPLMLCIQRRAKHKPVCLRNLIRPHRATMDWCIQPLDLRFHMQVAVVQDVDTWSKTH